MTARKLEARVAAMERELAELTVRVDRLSAPKHDWVEQIWGTFRDAPLYQEAMRLGRQYRESLRPKPRKRKR